MTMAMTRLISVAFQHVAVVAVVPFAANARVVHAIAMNAFRATKSFFARDTFISYKYILNVKTKKSILL